MAHFTLVAVGDSVMWGQGVGRLRTFPAQVARREAARRGLEPQVINLAHSGAVIPATASSDTVELRERFVDAHPWLFRPEGDLDRTAFIAGTEPGRLLFGEVPASYPTILSQARAIREVTDPASVDVVLMNGGANDIGFEELLDPTANPHDFVHAFDPGYRDVFRNGTKRTIREVRRQCKNAIIVVVGYHAALSPASDRDRIKAMLRELSGRGQLALLIYDFLGLLSLTIDFNTLASFAINRALYGHGRASYWMRKAVSDAQADPALRGRGVMFAEPRLAAREAMFTPTAHVFDEFRVERVRDEMRDERIAEYPNATLHDRLKVLHSLLEDDDVDAARVATELARRIAGPESLRAALGPPLSRGLARRAVQREIKRTWRVRVASFVHPNAQAADAYSVNIHRVLRGRTFRLRPVISDEDRPTSLRSFLSSRRLRSLRRLEQTHVIDSLAVRIRSTTSPGLPVGIRRSIDLGPAGRIRLTHGGRHFLPGRDDLFTFTSSTSGMRSDRLRDVTGVTLINSSPVDWVVTRLALEINGIAIFEDGSRRMIRARDDHVIAVPWATRN